MATDLADDTLLSGIAIVALADALVADTCCAGSRRHAAAGAHGVLVELVGAGLVDGNQLLDLGPVEGPYAGEVAGIRVISTAAVDALGNTCGSRTSATCRSAPH